MADALALGASGVTPVEVRVLSHPPRGQIMKLNTQPYKGARDFYPEDMRVLKYITSVWREVSETYGYEEVNAPLLELSQLYEAKSGEEIVNEQTYKFEDRGGRSVTIRPEMTPSVSRMLAARAQELAYPVRWYSIPNLWRYERPQRGRLREHWQLNCDIFGVSTIDAELELIMLANSVLQKLGADQKMYTIKINSRQLSALIMAQYLGLDPIQSNMMIKLLDKKDKIEEASFESEASQILDDSDTGGLKKLKAIIKAESMADLPKSIQEADAMRQVQILFTHLKESNIDNAVFDVGLMRGFDYYTDVVFEIFDNHPDNNRAIFGGGRYDSLVGLFGVNPVPTVGFGMGDVALLDFLKSHDILPQLDSDIEAYVVVVGDVLRQAQGVAKILREEGVKVTIDLMGRKIDKQLKAADKLSIPYALIVGEEELDSEQFTLKDLKTSSEEKLSLARVVTKIKDHRLKRLDN